MITYINIVENENLSNQIINNQQPKTKNVKKYFDSY